MEAPEKIYFSECNGTDIEYTRADAFIEKACEWLDGNLIHYWSGLNANNTKQFIEEFKKAMED